MCNLWFAKNPIHKNKPFVHLQWVLTNFLQGGVNLNITVFDTFFCFYFKNDASHVPRWCLTAVNSQGRGICIFQNSTSELFQTPISFLFINTMTPRPRWNLSDGGVDEDSCTRPSSAPNKQLSIVSFCATRTAPCCPFRNKSLFFTMCPGTYICLEELSDIGKITLVTYLTGFLTDTDIKGPGI